MLRPDLLRRARLPLLLSLALASSACASMEKSYRDLTPEPSPALLASPRSPEAEALVARFYGRGGVSSRAIAEALARSPRNAGLHEIAGYDALARADKHAAFEHFLAAAADQSAISPELYLWEMRTLARTTTDLLRAQAVLREIAEHHPRPTVRQLAAYDLARELRREGEYEEAEQLVEGLRFVDAWQVLGTFDNDQGKGFQTEYPPERDPDLARTYAGMRVPIRFRPLAAGKLDGALPLGKVMWPSTGVVVYAQTFVSADRARQVDLRLTTTNAVRVWLNGEPVAADDKIFHEELDNVVVRVILVRGVNRLVVKSAHETGPFRLAARFTELDGSIPAGLRWAATRGHDGGDPHTPGPAGAPPPNARRAAAPHASPAGALVSPLGAIDKLADPNRKRFLTARLWEREGHARRASYYLTPLLRDAPDNPVVVYFAAGALADTGETGKALDLWNRGAAAHPEALGFIASRAHFYVSRRLWDKAQKDLEAVIAKQPSARDPMMDLAGVYAAREWTIDRCREIDAVVSRWPDDGPALAELGRCKAAESYFEDAERALRRARALAPGEAYVLSRLLALAEQRLDYGAAESLIRELRAAMPGAPEVMLEDAELLRRRGKRADAAAALEEARAASPDAPWAYERLAQLAHEAQQRADAERWWRLALERDPENAGLAQRLAALAPDALPLGDRLAPTADDIERAIRSADKLNVNPGSHEIVLLDDEVTTVNPDGGSKRIVTMVAKAVTTEGRDALIQASIPTRRVNVLEAYSVKKNGERQEASSIQGGTVRFRNFEVGSIAVLQYAYYAPPPRFLPNEYVGQWRFQAPNAQVETSRWRLVLPKDKALNVETRGPIERREEVVGDRRVWTFSARGAPPLSPEPNMTPAADELWTAAVSTLSSWDAYARWEAALLTEAFTSSPDLDALAKKLTVGARTPREKLERLAAHVAQEIRYQQEYEDTIAGVKPHSAGIVLERGYGDCKDKAVLMIRLAKAVGIDLRFAVLRTTPFGKVWKQIPNQQFNHAIVYAPKQPGIDEGFFIDTTTNGLDIGNMRTDDEGALSLVIDPESGRWEFVPIPYQSADLEYFKHQIKVDLADPDKAVGHDHLEARGGAAAGVRVALRSGEGAKKYYQGLSDQLFSGTTLIAGKADHDQDLTRPLAIDLDIDLRNAVKPEDERRRLDVPLFFPPSRAAALSTRRHPLRLWRGAEELALDVDLGQAQEATRLPSGFSVDHPCFAVSRKVEMKGSHVIVLTRFRNTCPEVAPADYPAFREAVQRVVAHLHDEIVFAPKKGAKGGMAKMAAKK